MLRRVVEACGRPGGVHADPAPRPPGRSGATCCATPTTRRRDGVTHPPGGRAARRSACCSASTGSQNPFSGTPVLQGDRRSAAGRAGAPHARPGVARADPGGGPEDGQHLPAVPPPGVRRRCSASATRRNYEPRREDSAGRASPRARAARRRRSPTTRCWRMTATPSSTRRSATTPTTTCRVSETTLDNRNAIMGLGDGGAHVAFILDAGYPTWLLTHWGKQKQRWSVPELIRRADLRHRARRRAVRPRRAGAGQEGRRQRDRLGPRWAATSPMWRTTCRRAASGCCRRCTATTRPSSPAASPTAPARRPARCPGGWCAARRRSWRPDGTLTRCADA